jgi:hypothetical protein
MMSKEDGEDEGIAADEAGTLSESDGEVKPTKRVRGISCQSAEALEAKFAPGSKV